MNTRKISQRLISLRGNEPQETIAKRVGISVSALSMYEQGNRIPRDEIKIKLAECYGTTVEALLFAE